MNVSGTLTDQAPFHYSKRMDIYESHTLAYAQPRHHWTQGPASVLLAYLHPMPHQQHQRTDDSLLVLFGNI